jgi:DNA (cytosine-5)-methyltransferase 1
MSNVLEIFERYREGDEFGHIDIIVGGIPCQPFSHAGKRRGEDDNRFLWPEMLRIVTRVHPTWVLIENVDGFTSMALDSVSTDLEAQGYAVQAALSLSVCLAPNNVVTP